MCLYTLVHPSKLLQELWSGKVRFLSNKLLNFEKQSHNNNVVWGVLVAKRLELLVPSRQCRPQSQEKYTSSQEVMAGWELGFQPAIHCIIIRTAVYIIMFVCFVSMMYVHVFVPVVAVQVVHISYPTRLRAPPRSNTPLLLLRALLLLLVLNLLLLVSTKWEKWNTPSTTFPSILLHSMAFHCVPLCCITLCMGM